MRQRGGGAVVGWVSVAGFVVAFTSLGLEKDEPARIAAIVGVAAACWFLAGTIVGFLAGRRIEAVRRVFFLGVACPTLSWVILDTWIGHANARWTIHDVLEMLLFPVMLLGFDRILVSGSELRLPGPRRRAVFLLTVFVVSLGGSSLIPLWFELNYRPPVSPNVTRWSEVLQVAAFLRDHYPHWKDRDAAFRQWFEFVRPALRATTSACPEIEPCRALRLEMGWALSRVGNGHVRMRPEPNEISPEPGRSASAPDRDRGDAQELAFARPESGLKFSARPGHPLVVTIDAFEGDFYEAHLQDAFKHPAKRRGVVLDLRGCRGGDAVKVASLLSRLVPMGAPAGRFVRRDRRGNWTPVGRVQLDARVPRFTGPVAVLIDGKTGSGAEIAADVLCRAGRGRCFGRTTAGETDRAEVMSFDGAEVVLSMGTYQSPDGTVLYGAGVEPDVAFGFFEATSRKPDFVLEAAEAWLARASNVPPR